MRAAVPTMPEIKVKLQPDAIKLVEKHARTLYTIAKKKMPLSAFREFIEMQIANGAYDEIKGECTCNFHPSSTAPGYLRTVFDLVPFCRLQNQADAVY